MQYVGPIADPGCGHWCVHARKPWKHHNARLQQSYLSSLWAKKEDGPVLQGSHVWVFICLVLLLNMLCFGLFGRAGGGGISFGFVSQPREGDKVGVVRLGVGVVDFLFIYSWDIVPF